MVGVEPGAVGGSGPRIPDQGLVGPLPRHIAVQQRGPVVLPDQLVAGVEELGRPGRGRDGGLQPAQRVVEAELIWLVPPTLSLVRRFSGS